MKSRLFTIVISLSLITLIGGSIVAPRYSTATVGSASASRGMWNPQWLFASLRSHFPSKKNLDTPATTGKVQTMTVALINGFAGKGDVWVENAMPDKKEFAVVGTTSVPLEEAPESDRAPDPIVSPIPTPTSQTSVTPPAPPPPPPPPPAPTPYGKLVIPAIGVDAHIEAVGVDTKGNMGVPKDARNVAWYSGGVKPGEIGNAVIDGHYDTASGRAAVFFRLKQLRPGDTMRVDQPDGSSASFVIDRVQTVSVADAAAFQNVFGSSDRAQLVLITCAGKWNQQSRTYADRLLVFAHKE